MIQAVAVKWRELGFQLLNNASAQNILDIIEANHKQVSTVAIHAVVAKCFAINWQDVVRCCQEMFAKWLETEENASWDQLLRALWSSSIQLTYLANQIEQILDPSNTSGKEVNN